MLTAELAGGIILIKYSRKILHHLVTTQYDKGITNHPTVEAPIKTCGKTLQEVLCYSKVGTSMYFLYFYWYFKKNSSTQLSSSSFQIFTAFG